MYDGAKITCCRFNGNKAFVIARTLGTYPKTNCGVAQLPEEVTFVTAAFGQMPKMISFRCLISQN